ncbi:acyl-coenzyme A synthetase/AMP-(fatty) acid ligase [Agromyces sp. 3263]|uniref:AMP-binding enzyme n=1 Tax=Agromyces sp. 3263 TaxID=2817750 RepID=UPI002864AD1D|nr:long-chain fatty acid--CoA ligase [Agromyces sp. 3263]MDR6907684.1 acyl-coenzyme A synthetase/AMP-(fatty) acid ligase [Agromyces sp. 3263]
MTGWLRGAPGDVALAFGRDLVRYGELAALVDGVRLPPGPGAVGCPVGTPPVDVVSTVLAALDRGRPVLVGGSQRDADRITGELPAGTELSLLTSGSSRAAGMPRVVARTNASWLASAGPLAELAGLGAGDRVAVTGPLHVSMHLYAVLHALWLGASATDDLVGATVVHATPTRLARLLDDVAVPPAAIVAGAAMSDALRARAAARGIRLNEYYGAAELSFVLARVHRAGAGPAGLDAFPGVEVELRPAAAGDEVWARSAYLALGVIGGGMLRRDERGFATVGDLAERAGSGALRVLGRGDAAITTAGATVLAEDVEARLEALPGVAGAAVLGEPHELLGQRLVAVVELEVGVRLDDVVAGARRTLSPVELPRRWVVRDVPRTASGKVARGALRDELASGELVAASSTIPAPSTGSSS